MNAVKPLPLLRAPPLHRAPPLQRRRLNPPGPVLLLHVLLSDGVGGDDLLQAGQSHFSVLTEPPQQRGVGQGRVERFVPIVSGLTGLVVVGEARAEVVDQVLVAPLLQAAAGLREHLLGDLGQLPGAQAQVVALVGAQHLVVDVLVVRRVLMRLGAVDVALDLRGGGEG
ncbi:hypothetical protein EYF80_055827 [Liparis tanakae]|uniref:Uncharacterized protein n=1 Tax=Liparis tanakae TaxID=230148 RepID=A0A4Z2F042_9TELE|nr:hypothetical protein EYF80_055827 [Liparis tanakae]